MLICALSLAACSEETLTPSEKQEFYEVPQGTASYDNDIVAFYNKYDSRILYEYEENDFRWNITSFLIYRYNEPQAGYIAKSVEFIEECLDMWPGSFVKPIMPYYFLLCSKIYSSEMGYDANWNWTLIELTYDTAYGFNHVDFGYASSAFDALTASQKRALKGNFNKSLIAYACEAGRIEIPAAFLALSTPSDPGSENPGSYGYNGKGFLEYRSGMTYGYDFGLFVKYLTTMTEADFKAWALSDSFDIGGYWQNVSPWAFIRTYPIKQKYEIILKYFKTEFGIDLHAIGNAVAGN